MVSSERDIQNSDDQAQVEVSDRDRSTIWVTCMSLDLTVAMKPRDPRKEGSNKGRKGGGRKKGRNQPTP